MRKFFSIGLIVLGVLCLPFSINLGIYILFSIAFIVWGLYIYPYKKTDTGTNRPVSTGGGSDATSYVGTGRPIGINAQYGGYINLQNGQYSTDINGDIVDIYGDVVLEKDFNGNYKAPDDQNSNSYSSYSYTYGHYTLEYDE